MSNIDRRTYLKLGTGFVAALLGGASLSVLAGDAASSEQVPSGPQSGADAAAAEPGTPFDWDSLVARMKEKARTPYKDRPAKLPEMVANLDYDGHRHILFRPDRARWQGEQRNFVVHAFYPGNLVDRTVEMFEVVEGMARPFGFEATDFEYLKPLDAGAFEAQGFPGPAGFRVNYPLNRTDVQDELISFLGSSYFRALGRGNAYGLSARGLAVDTAAGEAEEFPRFSRFYLQRPAEGARELRLYAELESRRVTGAYAFTITPGVETVVEVEAAIFLRGDVSRLGFAPLTSMYLFGENDRTGFDDFRPEVHDSDGLAILRANGERVWRPLSNPDRLQLSFFGETNPRGFGLLQRDRSADNYLDTGARYERRPSVWVEPVGDWGRGSIMLAEIPTNSEVHDNVVAFWMPEAGLEAGAEHRLHYRMLWAGEVEGDYPLARAMRTRTGFGGNAAMEPDPDLRKFLVDFAGTPLEGLGDDADVQALVNVGNGKNVYQALNKVPGTDVWRLIFDVSREDSDKPVELIASLSLEGRRLTETWTYQWGRSS